MRHASGPALFFDGAVRGAVPHDRPWRRHGDWKQARLVLEPTTRIPRAGARAKRERSGWQTASRT